jgi:hypothetical protein
VKFFPQSEGKLYAEVEECRLLEYDAVWFGRMVSIFRRNVSPQSSGQGRSSSLKMMAAGHILGDSNHPTHRRENLDPQGTGYRVQGTGCQGEYADLREKNVGAVCIKPYKEQFYFY